MKHITAVFVLSCILPLSANARQQPQSAGEKRMSPSFREAATLAYEAIARVPYISNTSEAEYQPRQLDAEKALAAARRQITTDDDKAAHEVLRSWLVLRDLARVHQQNIDKLTRDAKAAIQCGYEAREYLDKSELPERFRKAYEDALRNKTCVKTREEIENGILTEKQ